MDNNNEVRWWETSQPLRILGLSGEPFAVIVLIPLLPFGPFIKFVGWLLLINMILSWIFRKNLTQFFYYVRREIFNNRRRIYNSRYSKKRFRGL